MVVVVVVVVVIALLVVVLMDLVWVFGFVVVVVCLFVGACWGVGGRGVITCTGIQGRWY